MTLLAVGGQRKEPITHIQFNLKGLKIHDKTTCQDSLRTRLIIGSESSIPIYFSTRWLEKHIGAREFKCDYMYVDA